ncbi:hypothetical protein ACFQY0_20620 [Haloferula chungangensis]|uniref:Nucleoside phosphorylase domain-containing protein n=1 Tax=Haloferula chungangensis TaxID=1048331 RepID=A0ABW2LFP8_9BACT
MKVLVVEDSDQKYNEVESILAKNVGDLDLIRARNFFEAVKILGEHDDLELLVLDIFLPMRGDSMPTSSVGMSILEEIVDGGSCHQPNHIICLSEFCADDLEIREKVASYLIHLVDYRAGDQLWIEGLKRKLDYIKRRVEKVKSERASYGCDVAILTASPDVEIAQVLKLPGGWVKEFCPETEMILYRGQWEGCVKELGVVACEAPGMGMTAACVTAMKLIERERPRYLVMCGILAGTDDNQELGDIIVGSSFFDYGSGKIIRNEDGERILIPDPQQIAVSPDLRAILKDWANEQRGMTEIGELWSGMAGRFTPRLSMGVIASGAAVVQDGSLVEEVKAKSRKTVGLEMEAYAVALAGRHSSKPKPSVLIAKSVCDFADSKKGDNAQDLAAFTSARFVHKLFTTESSIAFPD